VIESSLKIGVAAPLHFPDRGAAVERVDSDSTSPTNQNLSFRRKPESSHSNRLDTGLRRCDELLVDTGCDEMPAFLRDKIRRRISSRTAQFDTLPKAGQIWRFDGKQDNAVPLCVLLDQAQNEHIWQGWLAAAETDYATDRDVLLEPRDEPFDPLAGMAQTWNKVSVDIRKGSRVLAQLAEHRLAAIREVANGHCESGGGAKPGFVAPLKTNSGATVLAGTRIAHMEDPRRRYQSLYRTAAQSLEPQQSTANVISLPNRQRVWRNVGWSLAASVLLVQAAVIANLMRSQPGTSVEAQSDQASEYRAVPQPPVSYSYLEVYFKPDAREVEIRKLLMQLNATIADGPGEFGQYRVKVAAGSAQVAIGKIQASGLVDSARGL
jgi:hypothetical protein